MNKTAMQRALGGKCCPRHAALNGEIPVHKLDGTCGPLTQDDLGTMLHVALGAVCSQTPELYAKGALRAVAVLCASLAEEDA